MESPENPGTDVPAVKTKAGFVALIGAPNAGKSTLLNALVGSKVSIVSRKVQTTRALVRGIAIEGEAQIVFVDTPGIFKPRRRLDRAMVTSAWGGAGDADVVCFLLDARKGLDEEGEAILAKLPDFRQPKILILNKIDLIERSKLLALASRLNETVDFAHTFMISALKGDGLAALRRELAGMMPEGPWLYPEDQISDAPLRMLAAEITREKIYERLHEELPYRSTVETDQWQPRPDGSVRIEQTIFVEREVARR
jgi:GTP-binding protein Era